MVSPAPVGRQLGFESDAVGGVGLIDEGHFQMPRLEQDGLRPADLADLAVEEDVGVGEARGGRRRRCKPKRNAAADRRSKVFIGWED